MSRANVQDDSAPTMRLRDRKSGAGVLGDITNHREEVAAPQAGLAKTRSKVREAVGNLDHSI
jgi:hypothetical protein